MSVTETVGAVAVWGVIPAAGVGRRMGGDTPKQYLRIGQRTVLEYAAAALLEVGSLRRLVIAQHVDDPVLAALPLAGDPRVQRVTGGLERADSVLAAVESLVGTAADNDWVMVHDAARPCVTAAMIQQLLTAVATDPVGGILALPLSDTVKQAGGDGSIDQTLPREALWRAQTPQVFRFHLLLQALRRVAEQGGVATDEAMALELLGHRPRLVSGHARNIKVTYPEDLPLAAWYLEQG